MRLHLRAVILALTLFIISCGEKKTTESEAPVDSMAISYTILKTLPHYTDSYTRDLPYTTTSFTKAPGKMVNPGWPKWIPAPETTTKK